MRKTFPLLMALTLHAGCVVAVDDSFCESADIRAIVLDISNGDVSIERASGERICGTVDLGGLGSGVAGRRIEDDILFLDYACDGLCGGDITLTSPPDVQLDIRMAAGDLTVDDWTGDIVAGLGVGAIQARGLDSAVVHLATGAGSVEVGFDTRPKEIEIVVATGSVELEVPGGDYVLELSAKTGSIRSEGVSNDPNADASIFIETNTGSIDVVGW